jgi:hypothetical protein
MLLSFVANRIGSGAADARFFLLRVVPGDPVAMMMISPARVPAISRP